ncbi:multidrug effflux MFS transporter [Schaalia vaccimaxillae]|uniref:multidrug effflux MFS transporter n=1 Tax=Schaalia vaccimaxillae TaxID=183916 RepID=UPI0003B72D26|nr:multidrug effflux MFS transporter [Schaalia vaccimaxillae]
MSKGTTDDNEGGSGLIGGAVTVSLLVTLALQNAVPPLATDMYAPSFPQITSDLATTSTMVGLTLTAFFLGFGAGQIVGGALSDQIGRRKPMITGGLVALVGSLICIISPNIWVLLVGRFLQGFGGGAAAAVGRAILVDVAHGHLLARTMSLLQAIGGLAPMIAPVVGGLIVTYAPWRVVFVVLALFTLLMAATAWRWAPESLPANKRRSGGISRFFTGVGQVLRIRMFVGLMLTSVFSSFCMFGYISNSTYVLQEQLGLSPIAFSWVFAGNALLSSALALVNVRLIGFFQPKHLIFFGLCLAGAGVVILALSNFAWGLPLIPTCIGFAVLMSANAFIFGNASALALGHAREHAGTASAVQGLMQSIANGVASPLATSGGGDSATPMILVMITGSLMSWLVFWTIARGGNAPSIRHLDSPQP